jgi:bis(5'-nucleosidyl)-tetraphosphatase
MNKQQQKKIFKLTKVGLFDECDNINDINSNDNTNTTNDNTNDKFNSNSNSHIFKNTHKKRYDDDNEKKSSYYPKKAGIIVLNPMLSHVIMIENAYMEDLWGFPKGHVEENETFQDTAKREFQEETGINLDLDCSQKNEIILPNNRRYYIFIMKLETYYKYKDLAEMDYKTDEVSKVNWIPIRWIKCKMNINKASSDYDVDGNRDAKEIATVILDNKDNIETRNILYYKGKYGLVIISPNMI